MSTALSILGFVLDHAVYVLTFVAGAYAQDKLGSTVAADVAALKADVASLAKKA
jgi:hypothetical protein